MQEAGGGSRADGGRGATRQPAAADGRARGQVRHARWSVRAYGYAQLAVELFEKRGEGGRAAGEGEEWERVAGMVAAGVADANVPAQERAFEAAGVLLQVQWWSRAGRGGRACLPAICSSERQRGAECAADARAMRVRRACATRMSAHAPGGCSDRGPPVGGAAGGAGGSGDADSGGVRVCPHAFKSVRACACLRASVRADVCKRACTCPDVRADAGACGRL